MFRVSGLILSGLFLTTFTTKAAPLCSGVHGAQSLGVYLATHEVQQTERNMHTFSRWLGEETPLQSISAIRIDPNAGGAKFVFADRRIVASPRLIVTRQQRNIKNFIVVLMHEYSHAHLESYLRSQVSNYASFRDQLLTKPVRTKAVQIVTGVHELMADLWPSLALKDANVVSAMITDMDFYSHTYSKNTLEKIFESRKFEDNRYTDEHRWSTQMADIEMIHEEWHPYMLFAFARPHLYQKAQALSESHDLRTAQKYLKEFAARVVNETVNGQFKNSYGLELLDFKKRIEQILKDLDAQYP